MLKPTNLKNGMSLLRFPVSGGNTCIVGIVIKTGSVVEDGRFPQGISQLVERMFWKGTYKHPSTKHLNLALENIGGKYTSFTNQETTQLYLEVPEYNQFKAISFLSEIIQRSFFDSRDIDMEKKLIIEQLKESGYNVEGELDEATLANMYSNSTLGLPVNGSVETVNQITTIQVLDYLAHQYTPATTTVVISGNFDTKKTLELLEQEWSVWNTKSKKIYTVGESNQLNLDQFPKISYRQRGIAQTYLSVSFVLDEGLQPQINDEEDNEPKNDITQKQLLENRLGAMANLMVLNTILGQGFSSRLWSKGVEEEVLFGHIESLLCYFQNTGFVQIKGNLENIQFSFALECILSSLDSLKKTTVSINELSKSKSYLKGVLIRDHENILTSTIWGVEQYIGSGLIFDLKDLLLKIDKIDAPTIRSSAIDLFVPQRLSISTLGTAKETKLINKLIEKYIGG